MEKSANNILIKIWYLIRHNDRTGNNCATQEFKELYQVWKGTFEE